MTHTVLAVSGAVLVRAGIAAVVAAHPDLHLVAVAASAAEAGDLIERLCPDVVLVDHDLTDADGLAYAGRLRRARPDLGVVLLGPRDDHLLLRALQAGVSAYVPRSAAVEEVLAALRHAAVAPASFSASDLAAALARGRKASAALSSREAEVLALVARGLSARRVSSALAVGESTVKTYLARAYEKLGARTRADALRVAAQLGLVSPGLPQQGVHDA